MVDIDVPVGVTGLMIRSLGFNGVLSSEISKQHTEPLAYYNRFISNLCFLDLFALFFWRASKDFWLRKR